MASTRILIVDDNPMFIDMARCILSAASYEVDTALDATEALQKVAAFPPALILMDVQMPAMDGIALTRLLKANTTTSHIVIVAFTAYALKGDAAMLQGAGFDGYVAKPVDVMALAAQIGFWLEGPPSARSSTFMWP